MRAGPGLALAVSLLAALATVGCGGGTRDDGAGQPPAGGAAPATPVAAPAAAAEPRFSVAVEPAAADVVIGRELLLHVTVTNDGTAPLRVNVPRLDRSCATVRVRLPGEDPYVLERLYAELAPTGQLTWQVPDAKELAPGESVTGELSLTATEAGVHHLTVAYRRSVRDDAVTAAPVEVTVKPDGEKSHLGVRIATSRGDLTVRLRPDIAPNTVQSFATLARTGFFDGLTFHRIVAGFMAQGGDPKGDGSGGPGYFLPLEANRTLLHTRGVLSMARTGHPDTAGSQFFLLFTEYPSLDPGAMGPGYTTFGETVDGDETLTALESVETEYRPRELQEAVASGKMSRAQADLYVRQGRAEKSAPTETVQIQNARLVTLD